MSKKEFIEENIKEIIELSEKGFTNKNIAYKYGVSASTINRALLKHGIKKRHKRTETEYKEMIRLYENGISLKEISQKYHITERDLSNELKKRNVHIKTISEAKQIYTLDENYFDKIDNQNKAYLLGWLWSDGHNCIKNRAIIISLQEQDKYILDLFNKELKSNRPLYYIERSKDIDYNRQNQYRLQIVNKHLSQSLLDLGMVHNKGLTAHFPEKIPNELLPHFIRGVFDGDGYISKNKSDCRMSITGTIWMCEELQKIFKDTINVNSYIVIPHNNVDKPTRTLYIAGRKQINDVYNYMYKDAKNYLIRKKELFDYQLSA